jgi:hypothetical protein
MLKNVMKLLFAHCEKLIPVLMKFALSFLFWTHFTDNSSKSKTLRTQFENYCRSFIISPFCFCLRNRPLQPHLRTAKAPSQIKLTEYQPELQPLIGSHPRVDRYALSASGRPLPPPDPEESHPHPTAPCRQPAALNPLLLRHSPPLLHQLELFSR